MALVTAPFTYRSAGVDVGGEWLGPDGPAGARGRPAVLVLNGCGGYRADEVVTRPIARAAVERGLVAVRVDHQAVRPGLDWCDLDAILDHAGALLGSVADAVSALRATPGVDPERVAVAGYSLGALATVVLTCAVDGLVAEPLRLAAAALVAYPHAIPEVLDAARAGSLPPALLVTGALDPIAPPAGAHALAAAARLGGSDVAVQVVEGVAHTWPPAAATRLAEDVAAFLANRLSR